MLEQRFKLWCISPDILLSMFLESIKESTVLKYCVKHDEFPIGIEIVNIEWDIMKCCFSIVLYHPDWEIIPNGQNLPIIQRIIVTAITLEGKTWREKPSLFP